MRGEKGREHGTRGGIIHKNFVSYSNVLWAHSPPIGDGTLGGVWERGYCGLIPPTVSPNDKS